MRKSREFPLAIVSAVTVGAAALSGCSSGSSPETAPTSHVVRLQPSSGAQPSRSTTQQPTPSPTEVSLPAPSISFSQDQLSTRANRYNESDSQINQAIADINLLRGYPIIISEALSANDNPTLDEFRNMAKAYCAAKEVSFKAGSTAVMDAMYGGSENPNAISAQQNQDAQMAQWILQKSFKGAQRAVDYTCSLTKATDPAHIPSEFKTTPIGTAMANAPNQVLEDQNKNALVSVHVKEVITDSSGYSTTVADEDANFQIYTAAVTDDGRLRYLGQINGIFAREYYESQNNG